MKNIGKAIYQALEEEKWLHITYNKEDGQTFFWLEILDILPKEKKITGWIRNYHKSGDKLWVRLPFEKIVSAFALDFTKALPRPRLLDKLNQHPEEYAWLDYPHFDNNILLYLRDCRLLDNDPRQKSYSLIEGIDLNRLNETREFKLNPLQQKDIALKILKENSNRKDKSLRKLAINALSLERGSATYVVAYYDVNFDPDKGSLVMDNRIRFNGHVWGIEDDDIDTPFANLLTTYATDVRKNKRAAEEELKASLQYEYTNRYLVNTRPSMMILEYPYQVSYDQTFHTIQVEEMDKELPSPLKAFFGQSTRRGFKKIEPSIVLFDDKVDIDQMRAIYSSMKQPVTYVQGPPGTGKTQTLLNVILSEFLNGRSVLMTSQNNKPVDDIIRKLEDTLSSKNSFIDLPYLRLGNAAVRIQACKRILKFYERELPDEDVPFSDQDIQMVREENNRLNKSLLSLLDQDEKHQTLAEQYEALLEYEKILRENNFPNAIGDIAERKAKAEELLRHHPEPSDEQTRGLFSPANKSARFLSFLHDQSIKITKKLRSEKFKGLISICYIKDEKERASHLRNWLCFNENLKLLLSVFPILFTTNMSACDLGTGRPFFDLVIMDEAGQCNPTDALLPLARGNRLLLVGDTKQLRPVIQLNFLTSKRLREKYKVPKEYDYVDNSILDIMLSKNRSSNNILLEYHYRCGSKIISFPNTVYYADRLKLNKLHREGTLEFFDCRNFGTTTHNTALEEAKGITGYLKRHDLKEVAIITPFVNQAALINQKLVEAGIDGVKAVTVHKMQGSESKVVLFSLAISPSTSKRTWDWVKNNRELINVAMTRAKDAFVMFADKEAVKGLGKGSEDVSRLLSYMESNGDTNVIQTEKITDESPYANQSVAEREFYKTVMHFCSCHPGFVAKRNLMSYEVFPDDHLAKEMEMNYDLVLYSSRENLKNNKPSLVFEINGGEHIGNFSAEKRDVKKIDLCARHGVKEIILDNGSVKMYTTLSWIIKDFSKPNGEKNKSMQNSDETTTENKLEPIVIEPKEESKPLVNLKTAEDRNNTEIYDNIKQESPIKEITDLIDNKKDVKYEFSFYQSKERNFKEVNNEIKSNESSSPDLFTYLSENKKPKKEEKPSRLGWIKSLFRKIK